MPSSKSLTGSQLAAQCGVSVRAVAFYRERGLLAPVQIGSCMYYTEKDRIRTELLLKGKKLGFSLGEVLQLIAVSRRSERALPPEPRMSKEEVMQLLEVLYDKRFSMMKALAQLELVLNRRSQGP